MKKSARQLPIKASLKSSRQTRQDKQSCSALNELRNEIDALDKTVWVLLKKRFTLLKDIAGIKHDLGLPIFDARRERYILADIKKMACEQRISASIAKLYELLFVLSQEYQRPCTRIKRSASSKARLKS